MPKDSHLLSPASRALLSSVRAGCKYVKAPERSNRTGGDAKDASGPDGRVAVPFARTFTVGRWAALPRHMEPPEPEYLAKRRTNFVPMTGVTGAGSDFMSSGNTKLRRTKFKRTDPATGTVMVYDAAVPEGHTVEGEVSKDEEIAQQSKLEGTIATPSPGTVIEGVGIVDQGGIVIANPDELLVTPIPRRRFPPKRKLRGAGRGRRKKVMFAHGHDSFGRNTYGAPPTSDMGPTSSTPGANDSVRPESQPTPGAQDDDLDGDNDNDNYGDESDEDEEMPDRPESEAPTTEDVQQKDMKREEEPQTPTETIATDQQPTDQTEPSVAEEKPAATAAGADERTSVSTESQPQTTEKTPSPIPPEKPQPDEPSAESLNEIKEEMQDELQNDTEKPQNDQFSEDQPQEEQAPAELPDPVPAQEPQAELEPEPEPQSESQLQPNPQPQLQLETEPHSDMQPESQVEPQSEPQPELPESQLEPRPEPQPDEKSEQQQEEQPEPRTETQQEAPPEEPAPSPARSDLFGDQNPTDNFDTAETEPSLDHKQDEEMHD